MEKLPIKIWREPIDSLYFAICVSVRMIARRSVYGADAFLLVDMTKYEDPTFDWRMAGKFRLNRVIATEHGGQLSYIGPASR